MEGEELQFDIGAINQGLAAPDTGQPIPSAGDEVNKLLGNDTVKPVEEEAPKQEEQPKGEEATSDEPAEENEPIAIVQEVYDSLTQRLGIELSPEEMESIQFSNEVDTIAQVTEIMVEKAKATAVAELIGSHPDIERAITHIEAYGSLKDFNKSEDVNVPSFDISSIEGQREAYTAHLTEQGLDADEIKSLVENAEDLGKLADKAEKADSYFKAKEEQARAAEIEKAKQTLIEREAEMKAIQEEAVSLITKGKLVNFDLSIADKKALSDYVLKPVNEKGNTQYDLDRESISMEQELAMAYQVMKGFKNLIPSKPTHVANLRDAFEKNKSRQSPVGVRQEGSPMTVESEIDFSKILKL